MAILLNVVRSLKSMLNLRSRWRLGLSTVMRTYVLLLTPSIPPWMKTEFADLKFGLDFNVAPRSERVGRISSMGEQSMHHKHISNKVARGQVCVTKFVKVNNIHVTLLEEDSQFCRTPAMQFLAAKAMLEPEQSRQNSHSTRKARIHSRK